MLQIAARARLEVAALRSRPLSRDCIQDVFLGRTRDLLNTLCLSLQREAGPLRVLCATAAAATAPASAAAAAGRGESTSPNLPTLP
jgi:hypothetical protein